MNQSEHISKDLALWLQERGCEVESDMHYQCIKKNGNYQLFTRNMIAQNQRHFYGMGYPAYSWFQILVTHPKEFFGEELEPFYGTKAWRWHPIRIVQLLYEDRIHAAEEYFKQHIIFNNS